MSHRGYPGEGPEQSLTNTRIRSINIGGSTHEKLRDLYQDSLTHRYDILLLQETKCKENEVATALAGIAHKVYESHNPDNHNKGGVAIIVINPLITTELVATDILHNWYTKVPPQLRLNIQADSIRGRWVHIKFQHNHKYIHLINMYAPSYSHKARHHFYKSLRHRWFRLHNIIVMGDFNNVEDEFRDRMRAVPVQHTDDITSFLEFRTSHKLLDSYIEQYVSQAAAGQAG